MSYVATDLLQVNGGDIDPSLFPQLDSAGLETFLTGKLTEGYAGAAAQVPALIVPISDSYAIAWAYYMAFLSVWQRMSSSPASAEVDGEAKRTYLASQIQSFKDMADMYQARAISLIPLPAGDIDAGTVVTSVRNRFVY